MTNLTILLPIKNRPHFTLRVMRYLEYIKCPYRIIIGDGSIDDKTSLLLSRQIFHNLYYSYIKYDYDINYFKFIEKMDKMMSLVQTKYVAWFCDDDFINIDELKQGLIFLNNNNDFSFYSSKVINFELKNSVADGSRGDLVIGDDVYSMRSSIAVDIVDRFKNFNKLRPFDTGIHKKENLKKVFQECLASKVSHHFEMDFLAKYIILISGKVFVSDEVGVLRQHNTPNSAGSLIPVLNDSLGFFKYSDFPGFIENNLLRCINLETENKFIEMEIKINLLQQINIFYDLMIKESYHLNDNPMKIGYYKKFIPQNFKHKLKNTINMLLIFKKKKSLIPRYDNLPLNFYNTVLYFCETRID